MRTMNDPDPVDLRLAVAFRAARHRIGLPQTTAAVRAGVSLGTLRRVELYGAASTRTITALARVYGVTVDALRDRRVTAASGTPDGAPSYLLDRRGMP